ncbi:MAG: indole-3-glycerol phosphate synthase TrpC [Verrucomicrobiales bacterium]|nr:indole-3-glycerol phosphate synthase TrpC [Verrucomicrobiales bacterium]
MPAPDANILDRIVTVKQREVARLPAATIDAARLRHALTQRSDSRNFLAALQRPRNGAVGLIAEVKKASPSAGLIRPGFDPVAIARSYAEAGADCLSVLTDQEFFQGSLDYLKAIRTAVDLPLLRKDFIIDERQILEAVEWGADAILLIVAILDDARLSHFHRLGTDAGLSVLVEVHDAEELERALALNPPLLGVNNRNLKNFTVDLRTTEDLSDRIRQHQARVSSKPPLLVAESGIKSHADVARLAAAGAGAILVGESLMRHDDLVAATRNLMR